MSSLGNPAAPTTMGAGPNPTQTDQNVFNMLFGPKTCVSYWSNFWMYILFAVILAVIFAILAYVPFNKVMVGMEPNSRLAAKAILFFFIAWLLVWLFGMWFQNHPTCTEK